VDSAVAAALVRVAVPAHGWQALVVPVALAREPVVHAPVAHAPGWRVPVVPGWVPVVHALVALALAVHALACADRPDHPIT
jgi:hypothetical protein